MESLYKTKTINTFEEYKRFTWALLLKKRTIITFAIFEILFLFFCLDIGKYILSAFCFIVPTSYMAFATQTDKENF